MPVANLATISADLTYDHTVELLSEAYDSRVNKNKVVVFAISFICLLVVLFDYSHLHYLMQLLIAPLLLLININETFCFCYFFKFMVVW